MTQQNKTLLGIGLIIAGVIMFMQFSNKNKADTSSSDLNTIMNHLSRIDSKIHSLERKIHDQQKNMLNNQLQATEIKDQNPKEVIEEEMSKSNDEAVSLEIFKKNFKDFIGKWKQKDNCIGPCPTMSVITANYHSGTFSGTCMVDDSKCTFSGNEKMLTIKVDTEDEENKVEEVNLLIKKHDKNKLVIQYIQSGVPGKPTTLYRQ